VRERSGRPGPAERPGCLFADRIPGETAEGQDRPSVPELTELAFEIRRALFAFLGAGSIARRCTSNRRGEVEVGVSKAVAPAQRGGLVRESRRVEGTDEERRRAVAREDPPGAVRTVGRRGEPYDDQAGVRVAEAGDAPTPVLLGPELPLAFGRDRAPVPDQPGAPGALDHLLTNALERVLHIAGNWDGLKALAVRALRRDSPRVT
jgi:hypothetical protein